MGAELNSGRTLERLRNVREALLRLHKILLDYQRHVLERNGRRVTNSYELLNLVMHNPEFAWLHYLSELIVQMDEVLSAKEEISEAAVVALLEQAKFLLVPAESGDDFQRRYFAALQQSPDVVMAHSEAMRLLGKKNAQIH